MAGTQNIKKRLAQIFLVLLIFSAILKCKEYCNASEKYADYYETQKVSVRQSDLARKLLKTLKYEMNHSVKLTERLHSTAYLTRFPVYYQEIKRNISHHNATLHKIFMKLEDIKPSTQNTFFVESKCTTEEMTERHNVTDFILTARQCCSIESAARTNPKRDIYILLTCSVSDDFLLRAPKYIQKLFLNNINVHIVRCNMTELFTGTPVHELWSSGNMSRSKYPVEHSSDVLRFTLLWKFGGMYCDLDVITLRPVDELNTNYCGLEEDNFIGSAVLNFEPFGYGHDILTKTLQYLNTHFDGQTWSANGPGLVTNVIKQECKIMVSEKLKNCRGKFTVYNRTVLFPIHYRKAKNFFNRDLGEKLLTYLKKSSYTVHIWNKMSHNLVVTVGSKQAYALLADEYCPQVYRNCGNRF